MPPSGKIDLSKAFNRNYSLDHLGTLRYGTNSGGTQVWAWGGDAFGVGSTSGSVTVNIRMPGQYVDAESGLFYNWNRYYNPSIGRYISSDPIGIEGGLNTFLYANASPVMYIDPDGQIGFLFPALVAGGVYLLTPHAANAPAPGEPTYPQDDWKPITNFVDTAALLGGASLTKKAVQKACEVPTKNIAYETALSGGTHSGTLKNYAGRTLKEIQKAIQGYEKQVFIHEQKIANPAKFAERWESLSEQARAGLLNKWRNDAIRNQQLADVLKGLLNTR